ncbi:MAG: hypothetical protein ACTH4U_18435, partial [Pseudoalteromonas prydzensis]|uniref:hypothetical protein n=1 Tax=Pseudoalteromonas prydzensis TaxID=182141 RepID=UPI003F9AC73B
LKSLNHILSKELLTFYFFKTEVMAVLLRLIVLRFIVVIGFYTSLAILFQKQKSPHLRGFFKKLKSYS